MSEEFPGLSITTVHNKFRSARVTLSPTFRARRGLRWSSAEVKQLKDLYEAGHTYQQAARQLGRTPAACEKALRAHHKNIMRPSTRVKRRFWTPEDDALLKRLRSEGNTWKTTAATLNTSTSAAKNRMYHHIRYQPSPSESERGM